MLPKVRFLLAGAATVALTGGSWFYLAHRAPSPTATLTLYGNIDIREVQPAFNDDGHITAMLVQEGARVRKGQLLATLDDTRYAATLAQAKAVMAADKVTYLNDAVNYRRYAAAAKTSAVSIQVRDNAKAQYDAGLASYKAAVAAVALAQRQFDDTRIYAPSDGVIEDRILQPGDMASPATPVYTMALPSPLWVRSYVPERDVGRIRLGQSATVTTDAYSAHVYHGWVGYLSPTAEFTPKTVETPELRTALVYQLRVYVCDGHGELRLGMPATVHVDLTQPPTSTRPGCGLADAARH